MAPGGRGFVEAGVVCDEAGVVCVADAARGLLDASRIAAVCVLHTIMRRSTPHANMLSPADLGKGGEREDKKKELRVGRGS